VIVGVGDRKSDEGDEMLGSFSFVVPVWLVIPVLLLLVHGGVKLVKLLLMALKG
jgi:hypothetical protein